MDAIKAMLSRRSIKSYTTQPVQDEAVTALLTAAMSASSAGDAQPWHFIVIQERRMLDKIAKLHPHSQTIGEAPVVIVVCADERAQKYMGLLVQDCAAATQNLIVAAHAKGLGAVWLRVFPVKEMISAVREVLSTPKHVTPFSLIPIGHPAEKKPPINRYASERVRYNTW